MPSEDTNILKFSQSQRSNKTSYIIYADLKPLIKKMDGCKNNPEKSTSRKVGEHIPSSSSISTISSFQDIKNKHDAYKRKDCMKKFFKCLKKYARRTTNFKNFFKKEMKLLTDKR